MATFALEKAWEWISGFLQLLTKSGFEVGNFFHCAVDFPKAIQSRLPYPPQVLLSRGWRASAQLFYGIIYKGSISGHGRSSQLWSTGSFFTFFQLGQLLWVRPINFAKRYRETPCSIRAARTTSPKGHGVLSVFSLNRHHRLLLGTHGFCRLIHQSSRLHAQRMGEQNQR